MKTKTIVFGFLAIYLSVAVIGAVFIKIAHPEQHMEFVNDITEATCISIKAIGSDSFFGNIQTEICFDDGTVILASKSWMSGGKIKVGQKGKLSWSWGNYVWQPKQNEW